MPATLHLISGVKKLTRKKWLSAVANVDGLRPASKTVSVRNPRSGELITMTRDSDDADVYFPDVDEWRPVFSWRKKSVVFNARPYQESAHLRSVIAELVRVLEAKVEDDEGNTVPLE